MRVDRTSLAVPSAIHQQTYPGVNQCRGAHCTRFKRAIKRSGCQSVISQSVGGLAEGQDFCMGTRIVLANGLIEAPPNDLFPLDDNGPDRHLPPVEGPLCLSQGLLHVTDMLALSGHVFPH